MGLCISIISNEGARDGWRWSIQPHDIERILARYKEHVTFWNASPDIVSGELRAFANAAGSDYYVVAQQFDASPARRFNPEYV
jgi:hypothetical protein